MTTTHKERDYFLGTDDEEILRLNIQHSAWRPTVLKCWQRAGITRGSRVLDVGAGPGCATLDLAEMVGPEGTVVALERSQRFLQEARAQCQARGLENVALHECDLMEDAWPTGLFDAAWCRWVAAFVASPATLVQKLATRLRPGGVAIFHEYADYATWRLTPRNPAMEDFVERLMQNWRAAGGEPDVALALPTLLTAAGFRIRAAVPRVFCVYPREHLWQWPAAFLKLHLRQATQPSAAPSWATEVRRAFEAAEANPNTMMVTPLVLEIVAERCADRS